MSRSFSPVVLAVLVAVAALAGACGHATSDKAGGATSREVRVLRVANANPAPGELEPYARAVERASGGRLRIEFVNGWRQGEPDAEPGILDDVRARKVDLAWVGARAFSAEGVTAFDALIAPFVVSDYATEEAVLKSAIAGKMRTIASACPARTNRHELDPARGSGCGAVRGGAPARTPAAPASRGCRPGVCADRGRRRPWPHGPLRERSGDAGGQARPTDGHAGATARAARSDGRVVPSTELDRLRPRRPCYLDA